MADFLVPDDIVCYIVARLPAKPLLRLRCVSKHWNRMLREPHFMKMRSRKNILFPMYTSLHCIDLNVPSDDASNSIVKRCDPNSDKRLERIRVIGTINGIVIYNLCPTDLLFLYNPFTRVSKRLPLPPKSPFFFGEKDAYGVGYGATPDDLKIVRLRRMEFIDVFDFKEYSWSSWSSWRYMDVSHSVGHFVNGSLYWVRKTNTLIVLGIEDKALSEIPLPFKFYMKPSAPLGTINRCLCSLHQTGHNEFNMWVMKEQDHWSKIYSFKLPVNNRPYKAFCILDGGRIMMEAPLGNLIIYDTSEGSYKTFNLNLSYKYGWVLHGLEYVESLVSPSDMCSPRFKRRRKVHCKEGEINSNKLM